MTQIGRLIVVGFALLAAGVAYAQQSADVVVTIPARFQPASATEQMDQVKFTVMRDTKAGSGFTCFLLVQSFTQSPALLALPSTACE